MATSIAPFFRREDYELMRIVVDEPERMPENYDDWLKTAEEQLAQAIANGMQVEKVFIDADGLRAFCEKAGVQPDHAGRTRYAISLLRHQNTGHA